MAKTRLRDRVETNTCVNLQTQGRSFKVGFRMGDVDLEECRKWSRRGDEGDGEMFDVTAEMCARTKFTWWEIALYNRKRVHDGVRNFGHMNKNPVDLSSCIYIYIYPNFLQIHSEIAFTW